MSNSQRPIPTNEGQLIPHLVCDPAAKAIEFYKQAFGAVEVYRVPAQGSDKLLHAQINIDGQPVYLVDDFPEYCGGKSQTPIALGGSSVTIHRNVADCDAAIARAEKAGASVTMPAQDMFWGDRYGIVQDPFGHTWAFATHIRDMTPDEIAEAMKQAMPA